MKALVPQRSKTIKNSTSYTMQLIALKLRLVDTSHHLRSTFDPKTILLYSHLCPPQDVGGPGLPSVAPPARGPVVGPHARLFFLSAAGVTILALAFSRAFLLLGCVPVELPEQPVLVGSIHPLDLGLSPHQLLLLHAPILAERVHPLDLGLSLHQFL